MIAKRLGAALASLYLFVLPLAAQEPPLPDSIGTAELLEDGSYMLRLRAVRGTMVGEGYRRVPPSDPHYDEIKRHIGPIVPGEVKLVPPWPDSEAPQTEKRP